MRFNDAVPGCFLILFAIAEILYTRTFPQLHGQNFGPDLFPILIGGGLIICGGLLVFQGVATRRTVPLLTLGDWSKDRRTVVNLGLMIGSMVFYILFSGSLGFVVTSTLLMTLLLSRLGTALVPSIGIAVLVTMIIHTVFAKILLVPLPWGILQAIAW
ncbi:tripartite tricarboxylate transporter TctB family protein [Marinovum sp. 2_MG-2023]|uniref:tripartite tricarboxylate transporter TctB family protein n=1 Tax=unclassified Marinovum TaxID=2647166 RepID=UPI0026E428C2|nr:MULTISPECIES: tripartite tricarboxylate transporter TctB family protein [unclassified Marinovum]MDO6730712.1 tripartite tricarboxylate transporter TctB family protein [Marinovum sp. 2_MG-2023]MDO6780083.1 tripartite tricarboxylate transporter TctB family protein [Marinovum sp. 1_MG-2023]